MKLAIPEKERSFELVNSRPNILARKTTNANKGSNRVSKVPARNASKRYPLPNIA